MLQNIPTPESAPSASGAMSAMAKLNALKALKKEPSPTILPEALPDTAPIESSEKTLESESVSFPAEEQTLPTASTFEPPAFTEQVSLNQPMVSAFSDIRPLAPTQPVFAEQIPVQPPINQFIQNHAEIQSPIPQQAPKIETAIPAISNIPKPQAATPSTLEIIKTQSPTIQSKIFGKINLPFMRKKDPNAIVEPSLGSTKTGPVSGASLLEKHFVEGLGEHKGQR